MVDSDLAALRAAARDRATALGLPTQAAEDWRYVRCQPLATPPAAAGTAPDPAAWLDGGPALVLRDGAPAVHGTWPATWRLRLPDAAELAALHERAAAAGDAAACWAFADGVSVQVLEVAADAGFPLTVLNLASGGASGWHLLVHVAAGAALDLALVHAQGGAARSAPDLDLRLAAGARVRVDEVQATAWEQLLPQVRAELAAGAELAWTAAGLGGTLVRERLDVRLAGAEARFVLAAVDLAAGSAQAHRLTRVTHAAPRTASDQLLKAVLRERAAASCDGCVTMLPGAEGSDAQLQNRNLLLSADARADTRPQLDIRVDDVKAAHGATVGRLAAEELLYLRMRGLGEAAAAELLTRGHLEDVAGRMASPHARVLARRALGLTP